MIFFRMILLNFCLYASIVAIDQQLLMFIHTQSELLSDEEGLNVAYQALTAIKQKAAPLLLSESVWQHVVDRKDRFARGLQIQKSVQHEIMNLHHETNEMLKKYKIDVVNTKLNHDWYKIEYPLLSALHSQDLKHHLFDYFCYYIFNYLETWSVYRLPEGYILWIPSHESVSGFKVDKALLLSLTEVSKPIFNHKSHDLSQVLQRYLSKNKHISWTFYLTGHGYHKDNEHVQAGVAGMNLKSFQQLLFFLDKYCSTNMLIYSSCYGAGRHIIIPYQDDDKDVLLSYPVIVVSLTDAPAYVFGVPSGLKLPPYDAQNYLMSKNVGPKGLKTFFLQKFNRFCKGIKKGASYISLVRLLNPNMQCVFKDCDIIKIENVPLLRKAYSSYFFPLDQSGLYCLTRSEDKEIDLANKSACLLYVNQYPGILKLSSKLPTFVSMIPGGQVYHIGSLQASDVKFDQLIRGLFLSIDDLYEQNIYVFDTLTCLATFSEISSEKIQSFDEVLVLPAGLWLPSFANTGASCYVYLRYNKIMYGIIFDQNKEVVSIQKLDSNQQRILQKFKQFLLQECNLGRDKSVQEVLSSQYYTKVVSLQKKLLEQCLQEQVCKS